MKINNFNDRYVRFGTVIDNTLLISYKFIKYFIRLNNLIKLFY